MWIRYRFQANPDDPRPVIWPPIGPFWITGYGDNYSTVVAYLPQGADLKKYWPEADSIDSAEKESIQYSDRFIRPDWWSGE